MMPCRSFHIRVNIILEREREGDGDDDDDEEPELLKKTPLVAWQHPLGCVT
jgi:hypothetical protein